MVTINPHTTRASGTILTATIYNADHNNHITNAQNLNLAKLEGATPPVVDGDGVVWSGTSGALLRTLGGAPVPATRQVLAGTGMTGGGNLTADRTLTVDFSDQATAETGSSAVKVMSPLRTTQLLDFRLATLAESQAGSSTTKILTPQRITDRLASQAQAEAGSDNVFLMSPLRTAQAITALVPPSINIGAAEIAVTTTTGVSLGVNAQSGAAVFWVVQSGGGAGSNTCDFSFDGGSTWVTVATAGSNTNGVTTGAGAALVFVKSGILYACGMTNTADNDTNGCGPLFIGTRSAPTTSNTNILMRCSFSSGPDWKAIRVI